MGNKGKKFVQEEPSDDEEFMDDEEMDSDMLDEGDEIDDEGEEGEEGSDDPEAGGAGLQQQQPPKKKKKKGSQRPEREPIYDVEGLHEKLEDIGWTDGVAWEETLVISHEDPAQVENVDDDIARELAFYNQALSATQQAIAQFEASSTPWLRPQDYYAEMVKTDAHMAKVKEQLMFEQKSIEQAEERRKAREAKQYSKQVQAEKQKERNAAKKRQIEEVSKLRKQREKSGFAGEMDYDAELAAMEKGAPGAGRQQQGYRDRGAGANKNAPSKKRQARDAKFGFGGRKRLSKQNDAYSAAAVDGFKQGRFTEHFAGKGRGRGGGKQGGGRPGGGRPGGGKGGPGGVNKQQMKRPGKQARAAGRGKRGGKR